MLSSQIRFRDNQRKRTVVARTLVSARLQQMQWLYAGGSDDQQRLRQATGLADIRAIEAEHSKRYWEKYFRLAGYPGETRRSDNPVSEALDAAAFFLFGHLLRWTLLHRLSPAHGYLHEPVSYHALVYDLMEPVRHWVEQAVFEQAAISTENLTGRSIAALQALLDQWVEVPSLQVEAKRKQIAHGMVLALRSYLLGESKNLNLPLDELVRSKGRPVKVAYRIPGSKARYR